MSATETKAEATARPWAVFEHKDHSGIMIGPPLKEAYTDGWVYEVCGISGGRRNGITDQQRANAELIVRAVNNHDKREAALVAIREAAEGDFKLVTEFLSNHGSSTDLDADEMITRVVEIALGDGE